MGVIGTINGVNVIEQHIREYERKLLMSLHQARFALSAELNWNRNHAPTPVFLLRLKKPILPDRWDGFRNGWSKINFLIDVPLELEPWRRAIEKAAQAMWNERPHPGAHMVFDFENHTMRWEKPEVTP